MTKFHGKTVHKTTIEEKILRALPAEFLGEIKKQIKTISRPQASGRDATRNRRKEYIEGLSTEETLLGEEVVPYPIGILVQRSHTTHGFGPVILFSRRYSGGDGMRTTLLGFAEHYCDEFAADTLDFDNQS